jgi:NAD(P)H-nitrite reductase large subunit
MKFSTNLKKYDDRRTLGDSDLIYYCCDIDKKTIVEAIQNGSRTLKEIKITTKACTGDECATLNPNKRCCSKEIKQLIEIFEEK